MRALVARALSGVLPVAFLAGLAAGSATACASAPPAQPQTTADLDRVRESPGAKLAAEKAPQAFAAAEQQRAAAIAARKAGDSTGAELLGERAMAGYARALVLARLADAKRELDDATTSRGRSVEQVRELAVGRAQSERDADDLEKKLKIARETLAPAPSGPALAEREAARLVAARALAMQGRLLCGSARLLSPTVDGLAAVEGDLAKAEAQLDAQPKVVPIDAVARARAACLSVLTRVRRGAKDNVTGQGDALLAELTASSASWAPARDERGVVVTLHGAFQPQGGASALTKEAASKLEELGRVAAAHPAIPIQVVVHEARAPFDAAASAQRAEAGAAALVRGGASKERIKAETAGVRAPVVDPSDVSRRERNARLEVVFVTPGQ